MRLLLGLAMMVGIGTAMGDVTWPKTEEEIKRWDTDKRYASWEKDEAGTNVLKVHVPPEKRNAEFITEELCKIVRGKTRSYDSKKIGFGA